MNIEIYKCHMKNSIKSTVYLTFTYHQLFLLLFLYNMGLHRAKSLKGFSSFIIKYWKMISLELLKALNIMYFNLNFDLLIILANKIYFLLYAFIKNKSQIITRLC